MPSDPRNAVTSPSYETARQSSRSMRISSNLNHNRLSSRGLTVKNSIVRHQLDAAVIALLHGNPVGQRCFIFPVNGVEPPEIHFPHDLGHFGDALIHRNGRRRFGNRGRGARGCGGHGGRWHRRGRSRFGRARRHHQRTRQQADVSELPRSAHSFPSRPVAGSHHVRQRYITILHVTDPCTRGGHTTGLQHPLCARVDVEAIALEEPDHRDP